MHFSCRAIIIKDNKILLVHRKKKKDNETYREYYVVPGGKQELNESDEDTLKREIIEEIGIKIEPKQKILEFKSDYDDSIQKFYYCMYSDGEINTGNGPEFDNIKLGEIFKIEEIDKEELKSIKLVPEEIQEKLKSKILELFEK